MKNYITLQGYKKLREEFDHLVKDERPKLTEVIRWAASNGDRSENADYIYGKRRLREIDRRLRFLKKRLDLAEIVEKNLQNTNKVQFGATITLLDLDLDKGDQIKVFTIVGVDEIDLSSKKISWQSPLGQAVLGKERGDVVIVQSPKGPLELEIVEIEYREDP